MMKPGPNYKMSRATKTMLARNWDNKNIGEIRRTAIQGELYGRVIVKTKRDRES
jgi:hypothetical protein